MPSTDIPTHTPRCCYAANAPQRCERASVIAIQELAGDERLIPFCAEHFKMFADDFTLLLQRAGVAGHV